MTGVEQITKERFEQIEKHGRSLTRDYEVNNGCELSQAAEALIEGDVSWMPESWDTAISERMIGKSYKERLVIAGALIAAEIDRLQYEQVMCEAHAQMR